LIALDAAGSLGILERLYSTISVPDTVAQECGVAFPAWVQVHSVQNQLLAQSLWKSRPGIDIGAKQRGDHQAGQ
jgi:predicted nucleic acid-binding protein